MKPTHIHTLTEVCHMEIYLVYGKVVNYNIPYVKIFSQDSVSKGEEW
jgi:hypothetical protein